MRTRLERDFRFEAAHSLPRVPETHKCFRLHGHSYHVVVGLAGEVDPELGWLLDFAAIDEIAGAVIGRLDHRTLNDIDGLENPTCENLAAWLWDEMAARLPALADVTVAETPSSRCVFSGPTRSRQSSD